MTNLIQDSYLLASAGVYILQMLSSVTVLGYSGQLVETETKAFALSGQQDTAARDRSALPT
jgi:hypothetical protein